MHGDGAGFAWGCGWGYRATAGDGNRDVANTRDVFGAESLELGMGIVFGIELVLGGWGWALARGSYLH